jgi:hypothetical protein
METFIHTDYRLVYELLKHHQITDYRIRRSLELGDIEMEFEDHQGQVYLARVQYNPSTDEVLAPNQAESHFGLLEGLINERTLTEYQFRPDIPVESPNQALEFTDQHGQRYLIEVQVDPIDQTIHPPSI